MKKTLLTLGLMLCGLQQVIMADEKVRIGLDTFQFKNNAVDLGYDVLVVKVTSFYKQLPMMVSFDTRLVNLDGLAELRSLAAMHRGPSYGSIIGKGLLVGVVTACVLPFAVGLKHAMDDSVHADERSKQYDHSMSEYAGYSKQDSKDFEHEVELMQAAKKSLVVACLAAPVKMAYDVWSHYDNFKTLSAGLPENFFDEYAIDAFCDEQIIIAPGETKSILVALHKDILGFDDDLKWSLGNLFVDQKKCKHFHFLAK